MSKKKLPQFEFKIIAGSLKGKTVKAPDLGVTRPPLSRIRRSIFDYLKPYIVEAVYLDLFSGTGSYLFEAVSRGASKVFGVEKEQLLSNAINEQAVKYKIEKTMHCFCDDVFSIIPRFAFQKRKFDIIMIAPPQYKGIVEETLLVIKENDIMKEESIILCQTDTSEIKNTDFRPFEIVQSRKYGNTTFTILKKPE